MLQVIQSYRTGEVAVRDVPAPRCSRGGILVRNHASLISIGTERSVIELGKKSLVGKARARPDLVKRALEKAKAEGFWATFQAAMARLDTPTPLGYSSAGVVLEAGASAHGFAPGDRVACVGNNFASHAEFISVPVNLACRIPDAVSDEEASFAMLGAIAMHGVRLAGLTFGSTVAVTGLGLLGLIAVQILRAYGCRVVAMDPDPAKAEIAKRFGIEAVSGAEALAGAVHALTAGVGADAVLITAATKSDEPVNTAVALSRHKGRIVVVGVADIHPDRNEMWHKEVEIVVSRAGGEGALDPVYELDGIDLPVSSARWTQGRNVEEFLRLIAEKKINVASLITHRFAMAKAEEAYAALTDGSLKGAIGVVLDYPRDAELKRHIALAQAKVSAKETLSAAVIGAGQFGRTTLLPVLKKLPGVNLTVLGTSSGSSAEHSASKFGFAEATTDSDMLYARSDIDVVFAFTPHANHAHAVAKAIESGKPLFVEKPLCVLPEELQAIEHLASAATSLPPIMVGHNRRYSPHTVKIREWLSGRRGPLVMAMTINAGFVPPEHWVHDDAQGRSRIVGEMTHFLDLAEAITGSAIAEVSAMRVAADNQTILNNDNLTASLRMTDGSVVSLVYSAQGSRSTPREGLQIFSGGMTITSSDWRHSLLAGPKAEKFSTASQALGYPEEMSRFLSAARGGLLEPDFAGLLRVMRASFAIEDSLATGRPVAV
ncbi:MAG: zinc-binding dehydrogenase [Alphaproteobacteria bacterium]|nr:zinc-binding dehydrogenase [Alphaproteobacteria bacterium]